MAWRTSRRTYIVMRSIEVQDMEAAAGRVVKEDIKEDIYLHSIYFVSTHFIRNQAENLPKLLQ